jgi:prophage regulatory protein
MSDVKSPRFLRLPLVLERTGLGRDTVYRLVRSGTFPAPHRISGRASGWLESEISEWVVQRTKS